MKFEHICGNFIPRTLKVNFHRNVFNIAIVISNLLGKLYLRINYALKILAVGRCYKQ